MREDGPLVPVLPVEAAGPGWVALRPLDRPEETGSSRARVRYDREALYVTFECESEPPIQVTFDGETPVFSDECVEVFWQGTREFGEYLEFVVNPAGRVYAASVTNPYADRTRWKVSPWESPPDIVTGILGDPEGAPVTEWIRWRSSLRLPWSLLEPGFPSQLPAGPLPGNLYRIARGRTMRFEALSPTGRSSPPDFHVPGRFARFALIDLL
ncbi:MAG: hypothetical protein DIJKHBIC_03692 [Thermoanaerobaculia bacterium]|nr:hypothetical protein [Thermoanaerobaculia bacterium]